MEKKFSGKSLDEAKTLAYDFFAEYGVDEHDVDFRIIEQPVKKLFGSKGEYIILANAPADEKTSSSDGKADNNIAQGMSGSQMLPPTQSAAQSGDYSVVTGYIEKILKELGADEFSVNIIEKEDSTVLDIVGDKLGIAIGRRGETLDSLQYLAILANNRSGGQFKRISVDCNGYREKRRETLETLATRTASKVLKQGRRVTLEPMNPYERRIIHSKVAEINGVFSNSIGEEPFRKVVISANVPKPRGNFTPRDNRDSRDNRDNRGRDNRDNRDRPITAGPSYKQSSGFSTSFEREYKRTASPSENIEISQDTVDFEKNASVGKIEL
ncbi:MAG: protein jag [Oscillospiraceae bacterium]|nr:protein jag [Oscillospiraceae bacterium]